MLSERMNLSGNQPGRLGQKTGLSSYFMHESAATRKLTEAWKNLCVNFLAERLVLSPGVCIKKSFVPWD
jgi:hypothetical protein